jgi:hypothetical protein
MIRTIHLIFFLGLLILITACTSLRRYKSVEGPETNNDLVTLDLFGIRFSQSSPVISGKSLWDLSAEAQSQFIRILNNRFPDNSLFFNSLNMRYMTREGEIFSDDYTRSDIHLVFSACRNREASISTPADRIEYLKITLSIPDDSILSFTGWTNYSTEYGTIDIGDVSFTRSIDLSGSSSLSGKNNRTGGEISTGGTASSVRKEDQKVGYRYIKLNGTITNRTVSMEEEGTREIDLTGNISTDVSLAFKKFPLTIAVLSGLKDSLGHWNDAGRIFADYRLIAIPQMKDIKDTIYGVLEMDYLYRNVKRGSATFPEWDDKVVLYKGKVKKRVPLFTPSDYLPAFYCIGRDESRSLLTSSLPDGSRYDLVFRSYKDARDFFDWLRYRSVTGKSSGKPVQLATSDLITFEGRELNVSDFSGNKPLEVEPYFRRDNSTK